MKPLQTLDHVMLWIARVFPVSVLILHFSNELPAESTTTQVAESVCTLVFTLLAIGPWLLARKVVRIFLGSAAALLLSSFIYVVAANEITIYWQSVGDCLVVYYILLGLTSLLWSALRGARKSNLPPAIERRESTIGNEKRGPSRPWFLFSAFRHSVNSV